MKAECEFHKPYIVCITETWLDSNNTDNELSIDSFNILHFDRSRHGGGVGSFISDWLSYNITLLGDCNFESIIIKILFGFCKVYICLFYRPPDSGLHNLDTTFSTLCKLDVSLFSHFFLIHDFNLDYMSPQG